MEAQADIHAGPASVVVIDPGRAPTAVLLGAIDSALRAELPGLAVRLALADDDPRRRPIQELCGGDARVGVAGRDEPAPEAATVFEMPVHARPQPRTFARLAAVLREEGLGSVEVPVPGRYAWLARVAPRGRLRARGSGSGTKVLQPAAVGLRSVTSRGEPPRPPKGDLAAERAEHLRHRARSATMRARMDRNAHRLSRERLQTRHERARLRLAEQRLGGTGPGEWLRWRSLRARRRVARLPVAAGSAARSVRGFGRRARRYAVDRRRSRKLAS